MKNAFFTVIFYFLKFGLDYIINMRVFLVGQNEIMLFENAVLVGQKFLKFSELKKTRVHKKGVKRVLKNLRKNACFQSLLSFHLR